MVDTSRWGRAKARERYGQGGPVDLGGPATAGNNASNLDAAEYNESAAKENLEDVMRVPPEGSGKRFWDSGLRAPGKQAAKNYEWERKRGLKSDIVKE